LTFGDDFLSEESDQLSLNGFVLQDLPAQFIAGDDKRAPFFEKNSNGGFAGSDAAG